MELKKPTSFEEQVQLLIDKNIHIGDKQKCEDFLCKVNYYRFSAYYLPFLQKDTDKCFDGTSFERIQKIYFFDQELRVLLFSIIEDIEIYIRTELAYYHSHKYGADGYMLPQYYNKHHNHTKFVQHITNCIHENGKTLVVKHHMEKYEGKFPLWVIIEFFSIGMLSHFYVSLPTQDKKFISKKLYNTSHEVLSSWLRCLTDLRNKCAHYSRIYYWIFPALPKMPKNENYIPTRRLFAQLYMLKCLYPDKEKWNNYYLKELVKLVKRYKSSISLKHLDFPYRWKSMLKK